MIQELASAAQSIQILKDLFVAAKDLKDSNRIITALSEYYAKLIEAQIAATAFYQQQLPLRERITELEKQIHVLENWEDQAKRYELKRLAPGIFAHSVKTGSERGEPRHLICTHCFNDSKKSVLQAQINGDLHCHKCGSSLPVASSNVAPQESTHYDQL